MILAMDGGGSKTRLLLSDEQGQIQAEQLLGPCNYLQVGFDGLRSVISQGSATLCDQAGITTEDLKFAVLGIPAYGEIDNDSQAIRRLVAEALPTLPYAIVNDVKLAWAGALACRPGIVVLSGTGSMAYGVDSQNKDWRSGGWGHYFGDEGSAFWLGQKCCQLFSKMADGRIEKGPLYRIVYQELRLEQDFDIIELIAHKMGSDSRKQIAALAKVLYLAAQQGDTEAKATFQQAGYELGAMVLALARMPAFINQNTLDVSYAGGTFASGGWLLNSLRDALHCGVLSNTSNLITNLTINLLEPELEPVLGACLYGAIQLGWDREHYACKLKDYHQGH